MPESTPWGAVRSIESVVVPCKHGDMILDDIIGAVEVWLGDVRVVVTHEGVIVDKIGEEGEILENVHFTTYPRRCRVTR